VIKSFEPMTAEAAKWHAAYNGAKSAVNQQKQHA